MVQQLRSYKILLSRENCTLKSHTERLNVELFQLVLVLGALHVERFHNFFFKQLSE